MRTADLSRNDRKKGKSTEQNAKAGPSPAAQDDKALGLFKRGEVAARDDRPLGLFKSGGWRLRMTTLWDYSGTGASARDDIFRGRNGCSKMGEEESPRISTAGSGF